MDGPITSQGLCGCDIAWRDKDEWHVTQARSDCAAGHKKGDTIIAATPLEAALPTLEEARPEAVRCCNRVRAVLPPSDPSNPDDPSVALDTLMAMLHAALVMDEWIEAGQ